MNVQDQKLETRIAELEADLEAAPSSEEVQELRRTAADWQKQFHQLESLCNERGLTVGYGDHGQVTLSEESVLESLAREHHREVAPTQQLPGEDPPFDACRCPACVTVRAKSRSKP